MQPLKSEVEQDSFLHWKASVPPISPTKAGEAPEAFCAAVLHTQLKGCSDDLNKIQNTAHTARSLLSVLSPT